MGGSRRQACRVDRRPGLRTLLVAVTALALLVSGLAGPLAGAVGLGPTVDGATARTGPAAGRTSMSAPDPTLVLRAAGLAVVPAPTGPAAGLLPGGGPSVGPHLLAEAQSRPGTPPPPASAPGALRSRAPPVTTGT